MEHLINKSISRIVRIVTLQERGKHTNLFQRVRTVKYATIAAALLVSSVLMNQTYAAPGDLDITFGTGGVVTTDFGLSEGANAIVLQPDGKAVVAGSSFSSGTTTASDFALARYNNDGSLDASFGNGGRVTTDISFNDYSLAVALQPDGKIVVAGGSTQDPALPAVPTPVDFVLVRYNSNGSLDSSFGTSGTVTTNFSANSIDRATAIAVQSDGKIIAVGSTTLNELPRFALARYNTDGSLDASFGTAGLITTGEFGESTNGSGINAIVLQSDGKIVVAGIAFDNFGVAFNPFEGTVDGAGIKPSLFALARYHNDGSLDSSFGIGGKVITVSRTIDFIHDLALQSNGKIVAVGSAIDVEASPEPGNSDFVLRRYNSNGSLDSSFGGNGFGDNGTVKTDFFGFTVPFGDVATAVAIGADGEIVVAGSVGIAVRGTDTTLTTFDFGLARYNSNGNLDERFGTDGKLTTALSSDSSDYDSASALVIQSDGKITVAGTTANFAGGDFALARYIGGDTDVDKGASGGSSGGCSLTSNASPDPTLLLLLVFSVLYLLTRSAKTKPAG